MHYNDIFLLGLGGHFTFNSKVASVGNTNLSFYPLTLLRHLSPATSMVMAVMYSTITLKQSVIFSHHGVKQGTDNALMQKVTSNRPIRLIKITTFDNTSVMSNSDTPLKVSRKSESSKGAFIAYCNAAALPMYRLLHTAPQHAQVKPGKLKIDFQLSWLN